jgi:hypothetical protein
MKLSEALVLRADTQKRVERLRERLRLSVLVQDGEEPPEDPQELFTELDGLLEQLRDLISRINRTNLSASLESGPSLTDALAQRDVLKLRYGILKNAADVASNRIDRYSRTEIRSVPTVNVAALRHDLDALSQQYRELDTAIQAANWSTELQD